MNHRLTCAINDRMPLITRFMMRTGPLQLLLNYQVSDYRTNHDSIDAKVPVTESCPDLDIRREECLSDKRSDNDKR
jgi:hypothetical protein